MTDVTELGMQPAPDRHTDYRVLGRDAAADAEAFALAGQLLRNGGVVGFPTETVYGLGASVYCEEAIERIFLAKGRPNDNPLIAHIADMDGLEQLVSRMPEHASRLAEAFWPGPMTLVLEKLPLVPDAVTAGLDTVGVRMPSDPNAHAMLKAAGVPVAAPSANRSGSPSPTRAEHVLADMDGRIDMILDGGECACGLESTVIDCTGRGLTILRPGYVTAEMIRQATGIEPAVGYGRPIGDATPRAPGMKYRHYAPEGQLFLAADGGDRDPKDRIAADYDRREREGRRCVILATTADMGYYGHRNTICIGDDGDLSSIAHSIFDCFRRCDALGTDVIYMRCVPDAGIGAAIMNRVTKASAGQV